MKVKNYCARSESVDIAYSYMDLVRDAWLLHRHVYALETDTTASSNSRCGGPPLSPLSPPLSTFLAFRNYLFRNRFISLLSGSLPESLTKRTPQTRIITMASRQIWKGIGKGVGKGKAGC